MSNHFLKTHLEPFQAVWDGVKRYEFRKDDRSPRFRLADILWLREYDPLCDHCGTIPDPDATGCCAPAGYLNRIIEARVMYATRGPSFGVPLGYVVLSIEVEGQHRVDDDTLPLVLASHLKRHP